MTPSDFVGEDLAAAWDDLADRLAASPFDRPGWFTAWWSAFGRGRPDVLCSHRDGRLTGVLPVRGRLGRLDGLANAHTFRFALLAEDDEAADDLLRRARDRARVRLTLDHLMEPDVGRVRRALCADGFRVRSFLQHRSPYLAVEGGFEEYRLRLDARWLRQLERRRGALAGGGAVELEVRDGGTDLQATLDEAFRLESLGWKAEAGTAILSQDVTRRFYDAICRWAASRGTLRIAFLRAGGVPVATDIALEDHGVHYFLKTGFDPALRTHAPGLILRHDMIRRAFTEGLRAYEMLGDAEAYKLRWTDDTHPVHRVVAYPGTVTGRGARGAALVAGAAAAGRGIARRAVARARAQRRPTRAASR